MPTLPWSGSLVSRTWKDCPLGHLQEHNFTSQHHKEQKQTERRYTLQRTLPGKMCSLPKSHTLIIQPEGKVKCKNTAYHSLVYKIYWTNCNSITMKDGTLEHQWASSPRRKVRKVLEELHEGSSGHLSVHRQYYWLHVENGERWCQECNTCAASWGPQSQGLMYLCVQKYPTLGQ